MVPSFSDFDDGNLQLFIQPENEGIPECAWDFYKSAESIPDHYYARAGFKKLPPGEGRY